MTGQHLHQYVMETLHGDVKADGDPFPVIGNVQVFWRSGDGCVSGLARSVLNILIFSDTIRRDALQARRIDRSSENETVPASHDEVTIYNKFLMYDL